MASLRIIESVDNPDINNNAAIDVTLDLSFDQLLGSDTTLALARSVYVALGTDRYALADDVLPDPRDDDRRGWWADLDQQAIWGGPLWPIGSRLWLLDRAKLTDASSAEGPILERIKTYIGEALRPFVDAKICSTFSIDNLQIIGTSKITGVVTMYRGPVVLIALEYQQLWSDIQS